MKTSDQTAELDKALSVFQASVEGAKKGGKNPHFRSNYARLEDAWKAAREQFGLCGLNCTQWPERAADGMGVDVTTRLGHASGQWMSGTLFVPVDKAAAQAFGSAITYACRYAFLAALGLAPEDDDGNAAQAAAPRQKPATAHEPAADVDTSDPANFVIRFGKNEGKSLGELEAKSLSWYAKEARDADVRANAAAELERRKAAKGADVTDKFKALIPEGYDPEDVSEGDPLGLSGD